MAVTTQQEREAWEGEMFRLLAENVKDYAIFVVDPQGKIVSWSRGAERLLGFTENEIVGQTCDAIFTPEDVAEGMPQKELEQALVTGRGDDDRWHVRKCGERFWASGSVTPLKDKQGRLRGFAKIMRDRTELKLAADATREKEQQLQFVADHAPVLLAHLDCDLRYKFVNRPYARRFGKDPRDIVGRMLPEVLGPPAFQAIETYVRSALAGRRVEFETEVPYEELGTLVMHAVYEPERDDAGNVVGFVAAIQNVSQRKRAEAALAERNRLTALRADLSAALVEAREPPEALRRCCDALVRHLGVAFARIWTLEEGTDLLKLQASAGMYTHLDGPHSRIKVGQFKIGRIAGNRQPHLTNAVQNDPNISDPAWARREGMVAFAGFPLLVESRCVGVVAMFDRQPFSEAVLSDLARSADGIAQYLDRKRAEEELSRSELRFRSLMEQAPFSVQVLSSEGRTLQVNRAWEKLWGVTLDQMSGYNMLEDRQLEAKGVLALIRRAFAGEPVEIPAIQYDPEQTLPGKTRHRDPRRWVSAVAYPLKHDDGRVREVVVAHLDITQRKRAEEEREKFALLVQNSRDFIGMCGLDLVPFFINDEGLRLVGLESLEEAQRAPVLEFFYPEDRALIADEFLPRVQRDGHGELEVRFRHFKTGDPIWMAYHVLVLQDETGKPTGFATISRDIGRLKGANESLREADRLKDEFLAMLAHELRNPLAPVRNALHVLKQPGADELTRERAQEMAERQVQHMAHLLEDLLDVSRISQGKIVLRLAPVDLAAVVSRTAEAIRPLAEARRHQLTVVLSPEPLQVVGDMTRLEQVVTNLLTNACKYTDPGGKIRVATEREGGQVVVRVQDTGIGIAPQMLPKIFDLFVQAERRLDRAQGGVGIGLTLVKRLVELHSGSVEARSMGLGFGSEFIIRLPAVTLESPGTRTRTPAAREKPVQTRRILVVDDSPDAADSLALLLRLTGQEVEQAYDGFAALEKARSFRPEVAFLDIGMPGMDGYELARRLRKELEGQNIVLVALTGWGQEEDKRKALEAGFDQHITKPVDPESLTSFLSEAVQGRG